MELKYVVPIVFLAVFVGLFLYKSNITGFAASGSLTPTPPPIQTKGPIVSSEDIENELDKANIETGGTNPQKYELEGSLFTANIKQGAVMWDRNGEGIILIIVESGNKQEIKSVLDYYALVGLYNKICPFGQVCETKTELPIPETKNVNGKEVKTYRNDDSSRIVYLWDNADLGYFLFQMSQDKNEQGLNQIATSLTS